VNLETSISCMAINFFTGVSVNEGCELFPEPPHRLHYVGLQAARFPSFHTRPPPSLSGYHPRLALLSFFAPYLFIIESLQLSPLPQLCLAIPPFSTQAPPYCCSILFVVLKINSYILHILFSLVLHHWLL
jgi:hypothetical protein